MARDINDFVPDTGGTGILAIYSFGVSYTAPSTNNDGSVTMRNLENGAPGNEVLYYADYTMPVTLDDYTQCSVEWSANLRPSSTNPAMGMELISNNTLRCYGPDSASLITTAAVQITQWGEV